MVYIVDDDINVRTGFELLLKSAGYNSISFESAEAFVHQYMPDVNDLLLLDMHLPGMSGCDFLKHLEMEGKYLPVIVITAFDEPYSRQCARKFGALAFLRKPVDGNALIDVIEYNLGSSNEKKST